MIDLIISAMAMLAPPVALVCVIDDWFIRPGRQLVLKDGQPAPDPLVMRLLYGVLPLLVIAVFFELMSAQRADFSLVLIVITGVSGVVWGIDHWLLSPRRLAAARAAGREPDSLQIPGTVDYARSFFPVMAVLLVLRSFLYEPYRIPSDSMMPTLLDGDFILVNKYAYGVRLPVVHRKVLEVGKPARGDVAVFRFPADPTINYVKRVVGLPGDLVEVRNDQLIINGKPVPLVQQGRYEDGCYRNMRQAEETLDGRRHAVLHCLSSDMLSVPPLPSCNRSIMQGYVCNESTAGINPDSGDQLMQVPEGQYLMVGDNRDNSSDGRVWGFVDESLLVGRASVIWFNWDLQRSGGPNWSRMFTSIE
jgi:signal peptidase I